MRFGVCTWIFGDEDLASTAAFLAEAGFDGVELAGGVRVHQAGEASSILGEHGLAVLSLTPENVDLAHPDPETRGEATDYYLRLVDFAVAVGAPVVSCHGAVGRIRAVGGMDEEYDYLLSGVKQIAARAAELDVRVAMEVVNRYESHLLNTAAQAREFVEAVGAPNVGIMLDAYHMNIEEADPAGAIQDAGERLFLFHVADSNRQAVGRGHTDFLAQVRALRRIGYEGDVIVECSASGPDPFTAVKGGDWLAEVRRFASESLELLKVYAQLTIPSRTGVGL